MAARSISQTMLPPGPDTFAHADDVIPATMHVKASPRYRRRRGGAALTRPSLVLGGPAGQIPSRPGASGRPPAGELSARAFGMFERGDAPTDVVVALRI